jgi:putative endonuclease
MMMVYRSEVGRIGEDIACEFLKSRGYKILGRNIKERFGEIDILAKDKTGTLLFVEVKTATGARKSFTPEQHFNKSKAMKTKRIAGYYAAKNSSMVDDHAGWRIDLLTVLIKDPMLTDYKKDCDIFHYENV